MITIFEDISTLLNADNTVVPTEIKKCVSASFKKAIEPEEISFDIEVDEHVGWASATYYNVFLLKSRGCESTLSRMYYKNKNDHSLITMEYSITIRRPTKRMLSAIIDLDKNKHCYIQAFYKRTITSRLTVLQKEHQLIMYCPVSDLSKNDLVTLRCIGKNTEYTYFNIIKVDDVDTMIFCDYACTPERLFFPLTLESEMIKMYAMAMLNNAEINRNDIRWFLSESGLSFKQRITALDIIFKSHPLWAQFRCIMSPTGSVYTEFEICNWIDQWVLEIYPLHINIHEDQEKQRSWELTNTTLLTSDSGYTWRMTKAISNMTIMHRLGK